MTLQPKSNVTAQKTKNEKNIVKKITVLKSKYNILEESTLVLILIVMFVALSFATNRFFTFNNISNLLRQTSIIGVVSIGMTFVIISGGIDLSVGSVLGFSSVIVAMMLTKGCGILVSIIIALILGSLIGLIMGIIIHDGKVPPFIATLGAMTVIRGAIMLITSGRRISGLPKAFNSFSTLRIFGLPGLFFIWLLIILVGSFIAKYTRFGRNVYAIGSNAEAARLSGINIRINMYGIYALCAFTASIAGILMATRLGNGVPTAGQGYELDAVAAVVVGGASLSGAEGTILGTVLGAVIIAMIRNGGNLLGINPFILSIAIGSLIILAVLIDQNSKKRS